MNKFHWFHISCAALSVKACVCTRNVSLVPQPCAALSVKACACHVSLVLQPFATLSVKAWCALGIFSGSPALRRSECKKPVRPLVPTTSYDKSQANACTAICILPGVFMRWISFFARAISFHFILCQGDSISFLYHYSISFLYHYFYFCHEPYSTPSLCHLIQISFHPSQTFHQRFRHFRHFQTLHHFVASSPHNVVTFVL